MSDMSTSIDDLLAADDIENIKLIPVGGWKSELLSVSKKSPKNEDANYKVRFLFTWEPQEPDDTVDGTEAAAFLESEDADGARLFQTFFVHNKRDVLRVKRLLEGIGYTGSIEQAVEEIDGGYFATVDVVHNPDSRTGEEREEVAGIRFDG